MLAWQDVRFFLAVVRAGTHAAAARQLGVDETTVGRRLARLEAALESRLTTRGPDGLILTAAGDAAFRAAEEMERASLALERQVMGSDRRVAGRVRVTAPVILGNAVVLPALQQVVATHPDISIDFLTTGARLDVRRDADVAIRTVRADEPGLVQRRVGRYAMATYARAGPDAAQRAPDAVALFTDATRPPIRTVKERFPAARVALRTSSIETLIEAARLGFGAADLPCIVAEKDPRLARVLPDEPPQLMDVWLVVPEAVRRTARVRAVVQAVEEGFRYATARLENREPSKGPGP